MKWIIRLPTSPRLKVLVIVKLKEDFCNFLFANIILNACHSLLAFTTHNRTTAFTDFRHRRVSLLPNQNSLGSM
ncbi:hypothetical protein L2E82_39662 [Cichorium intybus]|uniref:Uncharacterized protein n=1 Tax=Cichorium intybus TaxID=13427 RepID=A0ACB9AIN2_CICIN|nr:hypothetical protein L2E82_39662 [Cichorium intybus]